MLAFSANPFGLFFLEFVWLNLFFFRPQDDFLAPTEDENFQHLHPNHPGLTQTSNTFPVVSEVSLQLGEIVIAGKNQFHEIFEFFYNLIILTIFLRLCRWQAKRTFGSFY